MRDPDYDAAERWCEQRDEQMLDIVHEIRRRRLKREKNIRVSWPRVPAPRLKKIWLDYGKSGILRDEKGMDAIADQIMRLIARLDASTELCSHTQYDPRDALEALLGRRPTRKQLELIQDALEDERGSYLLSDYAMPPLQRLYCKLFDAETSEERLHLVDQVLNVVHQRSDLAGLFVEGGTTTLNEIAAQGGYVAPEEDAA